MNAYMYEHVLLRKCKQLLLNHVNGFVGTVVVDNAVSSSLKLLSLYLCRPNFLIASKHVKITKEAISHEKITKKYVVSIHILTLYIPIVRIQIMFLF